MIPLITARETHARTSAEFDREPQKTSKLLNAHEDTRQNRQNIAVFL